MDSEEQLELATSILAVATGSSFPANNGEREIKQEESVENNNGTSPMPMPTMGITNNNNHEQYQQQQSSNIGENNNLEIGTTTSTTSSFDSASAIITTPFLNDVGGFNLGTATEIPSTIMEYNHHDAEDQSGIINGIVGNNRPSSSGQLKEEATDSGDELPPKEELDNDAPIHEIRCGLLVAKLHMCRFTCPGIHRKCVEFEGKLISPRQFTIKAEKDKQKDWKGSIRLGKHNLRTLMEMKTLDFYEHAVNCSLKCQSRNYIKNRKNDGLANGDGQSMPYSADSQENGMTPAAGYEMGEPNDVKSVTSSSSAASTRKSSTILEDYVSQTIPSMAFVGYGLGNGIVNDDNEHKTPRGINGVGGGISSTRTIPSSSSSIPSTLPLSSSSQYTMPITPNRINNNIVAASQSVTPQPTSMTPTMNGHGHQQQQQQSPYHHTAAALNLLQQTPLKQLLSGVMPAPKPSAAPFHLNHHHQQQSAAAHFPHISMQNGNAANKFTPNSISGRPTTVIPTSSSNNNNILSDDAALALLLQSVQTSILLEQQQKAQAATNGGNNTVANNINLLAQLASLSGAVHPNPSPMAPTTMPIGPATSTNLGGGMNGIERLLTAAALFPQLQSTRVPPKTPVKQEPMNVANIRKSLEENATMFWSQMRSMGLLDDMLKTLSDTLDKLKQIYLTGGNPVSEEFAAQRLSGVALALDLCAHFGEKVHSRYIQATLESTLIRKELLELQRKQEEQKRKLENAKRKSQVFDQLLKTGASADSINDVIIGGHHNHGATIGHQTTNGNGLHHSQQQHHENGAPEMKKIHLNI